MVSIKKLIVLCTLSAMFAVSPAKAAKTQTQTSVKPAKPKNGYAVSTTTGWRRIDGWHGSLVERDPNLQHWTWLGMREMEKSYVRLKPGQRDTVRPSRYIKPVRVATPRQTRVSHYMMAPPVEGRYVKPVSVPLPSRNSVATNARLSAPITRASVAAPRTNAVVAVPSTQVHLAAPKTNVRLAAPETRAQLASTNTNIKLSAPKKMPTDAMSDCSGGPAVDNFEAPDAVVNPYGPTRRTNYGYSSKANVKAKLVKRRAY